MDARDDLQPDRGVSGGARALRSSTGGRSLPRQSARSDVGIRPLAAPGRALPRRPGTPGVPDRAFARGAVVLSRGRRLGHRRRRAPTTRSSTSRTGEWLVNPGSVGQPRDGDPRAAWLELDLGAWRAVYHRVEYDIAAAAAAIRAAPVPCPIHSPTDSWAYSGASEAWPARNLTGPQQRSASKVRARMGYAPRASLPADSASPSRSSSPAAAIPACFQVTSPPLSRSSSMPSSAAIEAGQLRRRGDRSLRLQPRSSRISPSRSARRCAPT